MLHYQIDAGGQAVQMGFGRGLHLDSEEKLKTFFCFNKFPILRLGFNKFTILRQDTGNKPKLFLTLNMAGLSDDTFLTEIFTEVALQKSPRNTKKVSGSTSILTELILHYSMFNYF